MATQWKYKELEAFGRERLSRNFYMREFLHSEIAQINGLVNAPDNPELALKTGSRLCQEVLEPIAATWGKIHVRSAYRSPEVNQLGNQSKLNCASNDKNAAAHIWDKRDAAGFCGATACIVIPAYQDYFETTGDWASLAWWIHHHVPGYFEMCFFKEQCAFNIRWYEAADDRKLIKTFVVNPDTSDRSALLKSGVVHPVYQKLSPQERWRKVANLM